MERLDKRSGKGGELTDEEGTDWEVQDRSCDWNPRHPPHSINSNIPGRLMHENPFMLQASREDDAEKEGGRHKRWIEG